MQWGYPNGGPHILVERSVVKKTIRWCCCLFCHHSTLLKRQRWNIYAPTRTLHFCSVVIRLDRCIRVHRRAIGESDFWTGTVFIVIYHHYTVIVWLFYQVTPSNMCILKLQVDFSGNQQDGRSAQDEKKLPEVRHPATICYCSNGSFPSVPLSYSWQGGDFFLK